MQICWLWQKVTSDDDRKFQKFLDTVQYKCSGILRYERVFGQGYVSTGGLGMSSELFRLPEKYLTLRNRVSCEFVMLIFMHSS